jgi:hypothetical protein
MMPIGLTMKKGRNKYRLENGGELMLIHQCIECGTLSINRIAADDDPSRMIAVFRGTMGNGIQTVCEQHGILLLRANDTDVLYKQLYGGVPVTGS